MKRASVVLLVLVLLVVACESSPSSGGPDQSQGQGQSQAQAPSTAPSAGSGGGGGGDGAALAAAATAITDWCTVMPVDLVAEIVPDAAEPVTGEFPSSCTVSNQVSVVQISYQEFSGAEPFSGAIMVPDLGEIAWLEPNYPVDDAYLTVTLYMDPGGFGGSTLYVEVAGHDGVDHADDAIAVAQAVIAELQ
jgi:hypothetical protein